jgi:putative spermidine/putrescine transport system substrate-binding protein
VSLLAMLLAASFALTGCGGGSSSASPSSGSSCSSTSATPKPESEVVYAGSAGTLETALKDSMGPWLTNQGIKLTYVEGTSASTLAKVQAGAQAHNQTIDVFNNNDTTTAQGVGQGLWAKLEKCILTNSSELDQALAFRKEIVGDGPYAVRLVISISGLAYNPNVFQKNGWAPPTSWLDLFDPKYASCVVPLTPTSGVPYIPMLNYLTTKDYANDSQTMANFSKIAKQIPAFAGSVAQSLQLLQQGVGCLSPSLQGRVLDLQVQGAPLAFANPKQGAAFLAGTITITKDAPHPVAAQQFVNQLISAQVQQLMFEKTYFASTNTKVVRPANGPASKLSVDSEFKSLGLQEIPLSAFASQDQWVRDMAALSSK